ncbi:MAG: LD-carboxypeptidase [Azospirillaceae bacterium]
MHPQFRPLVPGDTIAVVSPADWLEPDRLQRAAAALRGRGFEVRISDQNRLRWGRMAGDDESRSAALMAAYADPEVRAILCARGGYGSQRLIDRLDWSLIAANPKPLIGYSDITALLSAIRRRTGGHAWHGPILKDFDDPRCVTGPDLLVALLTDGDIQPLVDRLMGQARCLVPGQARGPLVGGNLSLLTHAMGVWNEIDTAGAILFLEDVDEALYAVDRMLWQLRQAGKLEGIAGLMIGEPERISQEGEDFPFGFADLVADHCADLGVPVAVDVPCAHGADRMTLPLGREVRLDIAPDRVRLLMDG